MLWRWLVGTTGKREPKKRESSLERAGTVVVEEKKCSDLEDEDCNSFHYGDISSYENGHLLH